MWLIVGYGEIVGCICWLELRCPSVITTLDRTPAANRPPHLIFGTTNEVATLGYGDSKQLAWS
jgi:hypothetical protein